MVATASVYGAEAATWNATMVAKETKCRTGGPKRMKKKVQKNQLALVVMLTIGGYILLSSAAIGYYGYCVAQHQEGVTRWLVLAILGMVMLMKRSWHYQKQYDKNLLLPDCGILAIMILLPNLPLAGELSLLLTLYLALGSMMGMVYQICKQPVPKKKEEN